MTLPQETVRRRTVALVACTLMLMISACGDGGDGNLAISSPLLIFAAWAAIGIWINRIPNIRETAKKYPLSTHLLVMVAPVRVWAHRTYKEDVETLATFRNRFLIGVGCGITVSLLVRFLAVRFLSS